jgi:hypothetical protein
MNRWLRLIAMPALSLAASVALAQANLGELLDAGATKLSAEEFKAELVGQTLVGPSRSGTMMIVEMVYYDNGEIQGVAANTMMGGGFSPNAYSGVRGSWNVGDAQRICDSMVVGPVTLPSRCQYWYRYDRRYYLSDSDTDRSARVLVRTLRR